MKKKTLSILVGLLFFGLMALILYSCQKYDSEFKLSKDEVFSVKAAKKYFRTSPIFKNTELATVNGVKKGVGKIFPFWGFAVGYRNNGLDYVEIPSLFSNKHLSSVVASTGGQLNNKSALASSVERLLFYRDKNEKIQHRIVTYMPDEEYMKKRNMDISHNYLNNIDPEYNGFILYSTLQHEPLYMIRVKNGKGIKRLTLNDKKKNAQVKVERIQTTGNVEVNGMECTEVCFEQWQQMCVTNSEPGPGESEQDCFDPIFLGEICFVTCEYTPDDPPPYDPCADPANADSPWCGGSGDGGGGGGTNEDPCATECVNNPQKLSEGVAVVSEDVSMNVASIDAITKSKEPEWRILKSLTWALYSYEKGVIKLVDVPTNKWQWESLAHDKIKYIGFSVGGTVTPLEGETATPSFTAGTPNVLYAGMKLRFGVTYAPICDCPGVNVVLPPYTLHYQAENIWDAKPTN